MKTKIIVVLIIIILLGIVAFQNQSDISIKLYFWKLSVSKAIFIPASIFIGFIFGYISGRLKKRRSR